MMGTVSRALNPPSPLPLPPRKAGGRGFVVRFVCMNEGSERTSTEWSVSYLRRTSRSFFRGTLDEDCVGRGHALSGVFEIFAHWAGRLVPARGDRRQVLQIATKRFVFQQSMQYGLLVRARQGAKGGPKNFSRGL